MTTERMTPGVPLINFASEYMLQLLFITDKCYWLKQCLTMQKPGPILNSCCVNYACLKLVVSQYKILINNFFKIVTTYWKHFWPL